MDYDGENIRVYECERQKRNCAEFRNNGCTIGFETRCSMSFLLSELWQCDEGQDIAEYAVMLAVILVLVVGTIRLIGSNANNVFSNAASSIQ